MNKFISSETNNNSINVEDNIKTKHIFVLAGGQLKDGSVNNWVKKRLDLALKIKEKNKDAIIYCIGGGTYHKEPIHNIYGHVIHESRSCSNYLIENGIDCSDIKREWGSYDTIANGYFSFTNFILPLKISECILITSEFHMERAKEIFSYFSKIFSNNIHITYLISENCMDYELLKVRIEREKKKCKVI
jgi:vancomycin permeability regulator SanA